MKPIFIPLRREYFLAFERGEKRVEFRAYGSRWNEHQLVHGRSVTLSLGYSGRRLVSRIVAYSILHPEQAPATARSIYGDTITIIAIHLAPPEVAPPIQ